MSLTVNPMNSLYIKSRIHKKVLLPFTKVNKNIQDTLQEIITNQIAGKCIVEGYVKDEKVSIISYSSGLIKGGDHVEFNVLVECFIFYPVAGMTLKCIAKDVTKAGVRAESGENIKSPFVLFIARDQYYNNVFFKTIVTGTIFIATVIATRFELDDEKISIIATPYELEKRDNANSPNFPPPDLQDDANSPNFPPPDLQDDANSPNFPPPMEEDDAKSPNVPPPNFPPPMEEDNNKIAIIVPFRESDKTNYTRTTQLNTFKEKMNQLIGDNLDKFGIFVIEQTDDEKLFNRGALLNVGFLKASEKGYKHFIFHDVDLFPTQKVFDKYYLRYPNDNETIHIGSGWARYSQDKNYFGGINSFNYITFLKMNGFPNYFWGWGGEDEALYYRFKQLSNFQIVKVDEEDKNSITDLEHLNTIQEKKKQLQKSNEILKEKWEALYDNKHTLQYKNDGVKSVDYTKIDEEEDDISLTYFTKFTVDISRNMDYTPSENAKREATEREQRRKQRK
jgi:DNA-directed RNA polymerase subunit E'/Rpb7